MERMQREMIGKKESLVPNEARERIGKGVWSVAPACIFVKCQKLARSIEGWESYVAVQNDHDCKESVSLSYRTEESGLDEPATMEYPNTTAGTTSLQLNPAAKLAAPISHVDICIESDIQYLDDHHSSHCQQKKQRSNSRDLLKRRSRMTLVLLTLRSW